MFTILKLGKICSKIYSLCSTLLSAESEMLSKINEIGRTACKYIRYLVAKVVSRIIILLKNSQSQEWLNKTLDDVINIDLPNSNFDAVSLNFETLRRILEWKDFDDHVLEEDDEVVVHSSTGPADGVSVTASTSSSATSHVSPSSPSSPCCLAPVTFCSDGESVTLTEQSSEMSSNCFLVDSVVIKCTIIKCLQARWQTTGLIPMIRQLLLSGEQLDTTLSFLYLWENIISVRANLSVIDTKPFFANFDQFVSILSCRKVSALICRQILSLFNEFLCYGSTLALQDLLPDETCLLAHLIVRHVKDFR